MNFAFDLLLAAGLILLADATLRQPRTSEAIIQFMVFGLLTSLAWVRVDAPDLALTEAAIGSGVMGALLLTSLRRSGLEPSSARVSRWVRVPVELACLVLGGILTWLLLSEWPDTRGLVAEAYRELPSSGATNPVTAVVLNYRAWDTFLEMIVLWVAALCALALQNRRLSNPPDPAGPVFRFYLSRIMPLFALTIIYLVWVGSRAPGGAFPAGALLGGLAVLVLLGPQPPQLALQSFYTRLGVVLGAGVFALVAVAMLVQGQLLQYPVESAEVWILLIEFACTLSIGICFAVLFASCTGQLSGD